MVTGGKLNAPAVSKALEGAFTQSNPMKVTFLVNDKDQAAAIKDMLSNTESDDHENMLLFLQDHLDNAETPVKINALDSAFEKEIYIPAYNTPEFAKAFADEVGRSLLRCRLIFFADGAQSG